jgi:DNA mismatch repair protein MutL
MPIRVLPEEVASQIAAGEVVERPASVVKELMENALDARASRIEIHVEGAGKRSIEVADNGGGISVDELPLAVARHATSKLSQAEDLLHLQTLGFRGEALASIGSVSRLTLTTRLESAEQGWRLQVEGGHILGIEPTGAPPGTVVRVEELFFNVPARLKFLKSDPTERQQIDGLVTRYALAYPWVRFRLFQDQRPVLQTSGNGDRREVLASLYGVDTTRQLLEVLAEEDGLSIRGYISPIHLTRANRREITFFVNGRWIQDVPLTTALLQAYRTLIMVGRYPMAILFMEVPPENVDVNVHPAKAEVRFRNPDRMFSGVQRAIRRALLAYTPVPSLEVQQTRWQLSPDGLSPDGIEEKLASPSEPAVQEPPTTGSAAVGPQLHSRQEGLPGRLPLLRAVGQIGAAYLVAEGPDGLYLIDQHAAHERILFERMMARVSSKIESQLLIEPVIVTLPPQSASMLNSQIGLLEKTGFDVEPFGPGTFLVRSVPALLANLDPSAALHAIVEDFEEDETPLAAETQARLVARICKRAAVKAGHALSVEEQRALVRDLEACYSPRTCPHGRPTMIHLSVDLLERQFGRRGAR